MNPNNLVNMGYQNKKIPQTDKIMPQSRKMSDIHDNRGGQVILDDDHNILSDIQEPSDDHPSE